MKHINNYKIFESKEDIDKICREYIIRNYTINNDGSIDVNGSVRLSGSKLNELPLKFNRVTGDFYCDNRLTSLEGCPRYVGKYFDCSNNRLTSLEGCPRYVGKYFDCSNNRLTSLEGSPKYVGDDFYCDYNNITSLEGYPEYVGGSIFDCKGNPVFSIVQYFITGKDRNNLIELFNYYDIIQDMNVIYDRLVFFYDGMDVKVTDSMLREIEGKGYKIIR